MHQFGKMVLELDNCWQIDAFQISIPTFTILKNDISFMPFSHWDKQVDSQFHHQGALFYPESFNFLISFIHMEVRNSE